MPEWQHKAEDCIRVEGEDFRGSTRDPKLIRAMWRQYPDALPGISCGPSGLIVLDSDAKHNGPDKVRQWAAEHGVDLANTPQTVSQSGGVHYYFMNDGAEPLGCVAGIFKKELGTDVKGAGGQVLGPGSIRSDGKSYISNPDTPNLLSAMREKSIPSLPEAVRQAIGTAPQHKSNVVKLDEEREIKCSVSRHGRTMSC